jgi:hypothetical protein
MNGPSNPAISKPTTPRRPWWQFFTQFSLRTLLIITTIVAVACWWFLRPATREESLAEGALKLYRQVRLMPFDPQRLPNGHSDMQKIGNQRLANVNSGPWRLADKSGTVLAVGGYTNDQITGRWTIYHTSGRKAAEGWMVHGAKDGRWQTWNDRGQLVSEVHYAARPVLPPEYPDSSIPRLPRAGVFLPVGLIYPVFATTIVSSPEYKTATYESHRHGPACVWYSSGQLQFEGAYKDDRRDGTWTFYDEQGRVTEKREYK